jgi:D-hexose-6-phosphate mutarotase
MVYLSNAVGDSATISPYGAQVLSWRTAAGGEHLYCSPTVAIPGRPVRDGMPICFPQFANCGSLAKHGFARTSVWQMHAAPITVGCAEVSSACVRFAPPDLQLVDKTQGHIKAYIEQAGLADTVVWNPGPFKDTTLQEMPASDWTRMLYVEAAQIEHPIRLAPKESWQTMQRLPVIGAAQIMQDS